MPKDEGGSVILGDSPHQTDRDYRYINDIGMLRKNSNVPPTKGNSERHSQDLNSDIPKGAILCSGRPTLAIGEASPPGGVVPVEQLLWKEGPAPFPAGLMA